MSAVVCGLDVHKESTYATVLDHNGQVIIQRKMPNEDIPRFLEPLHPDKLAMEASTYIIPLYRKLVEQGYTVTVSHPKKTRYIAEARIKSDRVDSKALAELLRLDSLPPSYIPPREIAEIRERVRRRAFLVRQVTKLKVKIRDTLAYEGIKPPTGYGLFTAKGIEWMRSLGLEPVDCYLRLIEPLKDQLPREIDIDLVLEDDGHHREPELRDGAHLRHVRKPSHGVFDRVGDEPLDFQRREAWGRAEDFDLHVGHVRKSIYGQPGI